MELHERILVVVEFFAIVLPNPPIQNDREIFFLRLPAGSVRGTFPAETAPPLLPPGAAFRGARSRATA
jgi:hypothetical protein